MRKKSLAVMLTIILTAASFAGCGGKTPQMPQIDADPVGTVRLISANDKYGRSYGAMEQSNDNRVGIFYFLWLGQLGSMGDSQGVYDNSKMTVEEMQSEEHYRAHFWGEPLYGYYRSEDTWVFRRHLELLTMAGVDYIAFDTTNNVVYEEVLAQLLPVAAELSAQGWNIPKLMFMCNYRTATTVRMIYRAFYENHPEYDDLWYRDEDGGRNPERKPWIVGRDDAGVSDVTPSEYYSAVDENIRSEFYMRKAQWPNERMGNHTDTAGNSYKYGYKDDGFPWMSFEPLQDGVRRQYVHNGMISVSTAQHVSGAMSDSVFLGRTNYGRGFDSTLGENVSASAPLGTNFQEQWDRALSLGEVKNVFVTGWNEWATQKQPAGNGRPTPYFVDQFNPEYSRDIEMMRGGHEDNFYLQTARNIRAFKDKGVPRAVHTIDGYDAIEAYADFAGDTKERSCYGASPFLPKYTDTSGRNDIVKTVVALEGDELTVWVECAEAIRCPETSDESFLNILIGSNAVSGASWEGYQFAVNRLPTEAPVLGKTYHTPIGRFSADGKLSPLADARVTLSGNVMAARLRISDLGLPAHGTLQIKVSDHVADVRDIMEYYISGDSAPIGRLSYEFKY